MECLYDDMSAHAQVAWLTLSAEFCDLHHLPLTHTPAFLSLLSVWFVVVSVLQLFDRCELECRSPLRQERLETSADNVVRNWTAHATSVYAIEIRRRVL